MRFGYLSTYPPTQCGLATFTASLRSALLPVDPGGGPVARLLDSPQPPVGHEVVTDIVAGDLQVSARSIDRLNQCEVVIVQHEFGVYGGPDGDEVLALLAGLRVPTIVVLHTVLTDPSPHQREVLEAVAAAAGAVVTMTQTARQRLLTGYRVAADKVGVIAHGAPEAFAAAAVAARTAPDPSDASAAPTVPTVLTWGLLGPGKGIEWAIDAIARLADLHPTPRYLVCGQTHPKVLDRQGEAYRHSLQRRIDSLGLAGSVHLDGRYLDGPSLAAVVSAADVVLLPYDSTEQVTSGVLIEAVAAGKPVVATRFPHATELLSDGAGLLVPQRDPAAMAAALRQVLTGPGVAAALGRVAAATSPGLRWSAVGEQYRTLAAQLVAAAEEVAA